MSIHEDLSALETAGLIRLAQMEPELEYLFRHELLRDAVYHNMVRHMRKGHHQAVAESIEALYPDRLDELAPVLAYHFDEADDRARALHYLTRAGDVAFARFASTEAAQHYGRALELARTGVAAVPLEEIARLYGRIGESLEHSGRFDEALRRYGEMRALAEDRGRPQMALDALMAQATIRSAPNSMHDTEQARQLTDEALALARRLGNQEAEATILWNLLLMYSAAGDNETAIEYGERSLAIARALNLRRQLAFTLSDLASHAYVEAGMFDKALAVLEEARPIWVELGDRPMLADSLCGLALCHYMRGSFDKVIEASAEAQAVSESIHNLWGQSYSRFVLSDVLAERGHFDQGIGVMNEAIEMGDRAGFVLAGVGVRSYLARALGYLGRYADGIAVARVAAERAGEVMPGWLGWPVSTLARLLVWSGDVDGAEAELAAIRGGEKTLFPVGLEYQLAEGELALARGDADGALRHAEALLGQMRLTGARLNLADVLLVRARALGALEKAGDTLAALDEARQAAEGQGALRILWQILAGQAELEADPARSAALRGEARRIVAEIAGEIGEAELRESFLGLAEVRALDG